MSTANVGRVGSKRGYLRSTLGMAALGGHTFILVREVAARIHGIASKEWSTYAQILSMSHKRNNSSQHTLHTHSLNVSVRPRKQLQLKEVHPSRSPLICCPPEIFELIASHLPIQSALSLYATSFLPF